MVLFEKFLGFGAKDAALDSIYYRRRAERILPCQETTLVEFQTRPLVFANLRLPAHSTSQKA